MSSRFFDRHSPTPEGGLDLYRHAGHDVQVAASGEIEGERLMGLLCPNDRGGPGELLGFSHDLT